MPDADRTSERVRRRPDVHPLVERLGAYSWRIIVIGVVGWALLQLLAALRIVVFPIVVAILLTVLLAPVARWLKQRGWPPLLAVWTVFLGFLGSFVLLGFLIVPALATEFTELGPTIERAVDSVERWLIEDSPFDLDQRRIDELREQAGDSISAAIRGSGGLILDTAMLVLEVVAGVLLALVMTFFFLKDGERFQQWAVARIPEERRDVVCRGANRGWHTIGGYLRGSAVLGVLEAVAIGLTLLLTGASLVVPVMALTFLAAFVPFVGAVVAGLIAVAVALATTGFTEAVIVAAVALVVQQLDSDLLAPVVFGKALSLHPLIIVVSITAGATLAGLAGAFLAVPLTATVINVVTEVRQQADGRDPVTP